MKNTAQKANEILIAMYNKEISELKKEFSGRDTTEDGDIRNEYVSKHSEIYERYNVIFRALA